jgi:hypothetical protein
MGKIKLDCAFEECDGKVDAVIALADDGVTTKYSKCSKCDRHTVQCQNGKPIKYEPKSNTNNSGL